MLKKLAFGALAVVALLVAVTFVVFANTPKMMGPSLVAGQAFPVEQATELHAGMSPDQVEALLGTPLERVDGTPARWRYDFTRTPRVCVVGLFPKIPTERHAVSLEFGRRGLERAVYLEVSAGRSTQRVLVDTSEADGDEAANAGD